MGSFDDTEAQMKHDVEFFDKMKTDCEKKSKEWNERVELRKEELDGIKKAIEILSSDDARRLFDKSMAADFLQVAAQPVRTRQEQAYDVVRILTGDTKKLEFARLAVSIK